MKKKNLTTEKIVNGIKAPGGFSTQSEFNLASKMNNVPNSYKSTNFSKAKKTKYLKKLNMLGKF